MASIAVMDSQSSGAWTGVFPRFPALFGKRLV
jgi:hypothetical protein